MNSRYAPNGEKASGSCPACGAAVWAGVRFCAACGAATSWPAQANTIAAAPERLSAWRILFAMMTSPSRVLSGPMGQISWPFSLGVSGTAFTLFFLQTGLDIARAGSKTPGLGALFAVLGAIYGTAGVLVLGVIASVLGRFIGGEKPVSWFLRAVALSFSPALVYAAIGVPFNLLLGWNTSLAFGVPGIVWALGPMTALFREASGGKRGASFTMALLCQALVLLGWSVFTQ
jgi:hypothetical protein